MLLYLFRYKIKLCMEFEYIFVIYNEIILLVMIIRICLLFLTLEAVRV